VGLFPVTAYTIRNDEQLIELFLEGARDEADWSFKALVTRHEPVILRICRRVLSRREDAEDASQATFVALIRNAGKIRNRRMLGPWLCGVAYRTAIRMKVASARRRELSGRAFEKVPPRPAEEAAIFRELGRILRDEIDRLPEDLRTVVMHSYLEGKSNAEVARFLGCSIGTVKGRLSRARGMLRKQLARRVDGAVEIFAGPGGRIPHIPMPRRGEPGRALALATSRFGHLGGPALALLKPINRPLLPALRHSRNRKQPLDVIAITGVDAKYVSDGETISRPLDYADVITRPQTPLAD
jgi:RNA polymerase sigma factor (sigma-70 family)